MKYLASPYLDQNPAVMLKRHNYALEVLTWLTAMRYDVYSPIVNGHPQHVHARNLYRKDTLPTDFKFWRSQNHHHLNHCSDMYILTLDGWQNSAGVIDEIAFCKENGKNMYLLEHDPVAITMLQPPKLIPHSVETMA